MWGQNWGQMRWMGAAGGVPTLGLWGALLLGCVLGIVGVVSLRSARKTALIVLALALLIPLSALAAVPFIFVNGTVADATQVNANFAAVIPRAGRTHVSYGFASGSSEPSKFVFATPSFVAPRDLVCVVNLSLLNSTNLTGRVYFWQPAVKVGTAERTELFDESVSPYLVEGYNSGTDIHYSGSRTQIFSVTGGSSVSFGAYVFPSGSQTAAHLTAVYTCSPTP